MLLCFSFKAIRVFSVDSFTHLLKKLGFHTLWFYEVDLLGNENEGKNGQEPADLEYNKVVFL